MIDHERKTLTFDHGCHFVQPGEEIVIDTRTVVDLDTGEIISEEPIERG